MNQNIFAFLLNHIRKSRWLARARRLFARGRYDSAAGWCQMVLELDRGCKPARQLLDRIRGAAFRDAASRASSEPSLEAELNAAFWSIELERPADVGVHARRATRLHVRSGEPQPSAELMLLRGQASCLNGFYRRAIAELEEAHRLLGTGLTGIEATYYLGLCFLAMSKEAECRRCFSQVVSKYPWLAADRLQDLIEKIQPDSR